MNDEMKFKLEMDTYNSANFAHVMTLVKELLKDDFVSGNSKLTITHRISKEND